MQPNNSKTLVQEALEGYTDTVLKEIYRGCLSIAKRLQQEPPTVVWPITEHNAMKIQDVRDFGTFLGLVEKELGRRGIDGTKLK